jgi:hypothetical protein
MSKKVAICQSNYIPWKGYFSMINRVDEFVLYDEMQFTKNDWRNRNIIKTGQGLQWLSIPVKVSGLFGQKINESEVANQIWRKKHWKTICQNYSKAAYFHQYKTQFEELYLEDNETFLSQINYKFIVLVCEILNIDTNLSWSKDYEIVGEKSERVLNICCQLGATTYISGSAAKDYLDESIFKDRNIEINWMDYTNYLEYSQLFDGFEHGVSVLDLIFNLGDEAKNYI